MTGGGVDVVAGGGFGVVVEADVDGAAWGGDAFKFWEQGSVCGVADRAGDG